MIDHFGNRQLIEKRSQADSCSSCPISNDAGILCAEPRPAKEQCYCLCSPYSKEGTCKLQEGVQNIASRIVLPLLYLLIIAPV